jgi:hypothetical protein
MLMCVYIITFEKCICFGIYLFVCMNTFWITDCMSSYLILHAMLAVSRLVKVDWFDLGNEMIPLGLHILSITVVMKS